MLKDYESVYTVSAHLCLDTNDFPRTEEGDIDPSYNDYFIPCSKGELRDGVAGKYAWYCDNLTTGRNIYNKLLTTNKEDIVSYDETSSEVIIILKNIECIEKLVRPRKRTKKDATLPSKVVVKQYINIPSKEYYQLMGLVSDIPDKRNKLKELDASFWNKVATRKMKNEQKSLKRVSTRTYIYNNGMWDQFIEYVKESING